MKEYTHFGNDHFDPDRFRPIRNEAYSAKPEYGTGLWASPGGDVSDYSWLAFLEDVRIDKRSDVHFNFTLRDDATICTIDNINDFQKIEEFVLNKDKLKYLHAGSIMLWTIYLDFEAMVRHGIDAVELDLTKNYSDLHYALYDWDVNSILIMNKDIIIPK